MDFVTPALLGGTLLAAIPVVLHLVMRQQPRHLEFPALRFLEQRQEANRRKLKLRHLLLLLLRMSAIGLLAFALARPSLKAKSVIGGQEAPVAAALVFDTSPRMDYKFENKTRLQVAQEAAHWLLKELPAESQVAVLDATRSQPVFQVDLGAAQQRVGRLETTTVARPLAEIIAGAAKLLEKGDPTGAELPQRKEIYVFTDLTRVAWDAGSASSLPAELAKLNALGLYVVDAGIAEPQNFALGDVRLDADVLPRNRPCEIETDVSAVGGEGRRVVEAYLVNDQRQPEKRGEETVEVKPQENRSVTFNLGKLDVGTFQGYLRIVGSDALAADDRRFFSVEVKPAWRVLLAAAPPAEERALFPTEALAPEGLRKSGQARFACDVVTLERLAGQAFDDYSVVALLDPGPLPTETWQRLGDYAAAGGSVAVFLGAAAEPKQFNGAAAQKLLAGPLGLPAHYPEGNLLFTTFGNQHELLAKFRPLADTVPWEGMPIYRYWQMPKLAEGVGVAARYSNNQPAILERSVGQGRALTMTTPISDSEDASEDNLWNRLGTGPEPWPYVVLVDQIFAYLAGNREARLNYLAGDTIALRLGQHERFPAYLLSTPRDETMRLTAERGQTSLIINAADELGNYRLQAGGKSEGIDRGFSVNLAASATDLTRADEQQLSEVLGETEFRIARDRQEIDRTVSTGRVGVELFPWLIVGLAFVLGLEHALANLFYRDRKPRTAA